MATSKKPLTKGQIVSYVAEKFELSKKNNFWNTNAGSFTPIPLLDLIIGFNLF